MIGAVDPSTGLPDSLIWAYQASLNHQADLLFWVETSFKPGKRLDPSDPRDRAMIPAWYAARARIAQTRTPRQLIRDRAVETATDAHARDPRPVFVYAARAGGSDTRAFSALRDPQAEDYVRARLRDSSYVAIFNAEDSRWPQPIYENYPAEGSSPSVSGDLSRGEAPPVIHHEGLVLRPLTPEVLARLPDLDPVRRDAQVEAACVGWVDFEGNRRPPKLIRRICRPDDDLYYWDGPWGALSGSRGLAIVRGGRVVETFTTLIS